MNITNKLEILFVCSGNSEFGIVPFIKSQGESLKAKKVNIDYFTIKDKGLFGYIKNIPLLRKQLNKNKYDVVHAHYGFCGWLCIFQLKTPVVVSLMGSDLLGIPKWDGSQTAIGYFNIISSIILQFFVKKIIVKSDEMKKKCIRRKKVNVIPNGVDFKVFKPIDKVLSRRLFNLDIDKKYILFLGDPNNPRKNIILAEESYKILKKLDNKNVEFLKPYPVAYDQIPNYLNAVDVLAMTSYWEGSPNVIKEAMACNCPIVSTSVGDVKNIIQGTKGCFISSYSPDDVANKINSALMYGKKTKGREIISHLEIAKIADSIIGLYNNILIS